MSIEGAAGTTNTPRTRETSSMVDAPGVRAAQATSSGPRARIASGLPTAKRRMLIIVNPYATTVSDRLRHLVVYALQGRFEVDAVDTEADRKSVCRERV